MAQLRDDYHEFTRRGAEILAIGPDSPDKFRWWWRELKMPFPGLPDPGHRVARRYGQQVKILRLGRMPAAFFIGKDGQIHFERYGRSMSDIVSTADLTRAIDSVSAR